MNFNLREKLESARTVQRAFDGLPRDDGSPWQVAPTDTAGQPRALRLRPLGWGEDLPTWTGRSTANARLIDLTPQAGSDPLTTPVVADGDACPTCDGPVGSDLVDLVGGVHYLSCGDCGLRFQVGV